MYESFVLYLSIAIEKTSGISGNARFPQFPATLIPIAPNCKERWGFKPRFKIEKGQFGPLIVVPKIRGVI